jgi:hypothetical protein
MDTKDELDKIIEELNEAKTDELFDKIVEVVKRTGVVIGVPNS